MAHKFWNIFEHLSLELSYIWHDSKWKWKCNCDSLSIRMNPYNFFDARKRHHYRYKLFLGSMHWARINSDIFQLWKNLILHTQWSISLIACLPHPSAFDAVTSFRVTMSFLDSSWDFGVEIAVCRWITDDCVSTFVSHGK